MRNMGICAAVEEEIALGLNLAGVEEIFVLEGPDEKTKLKQWYDDMLSKEMGLMILSKTSGDLLSHELFDKRSQNIMLPVVVVMPGEGEDRRAADLIKRAVGMDPSNIDGGQDDDDR